MTVTTDRSIIEFAKTNVLSNPRLPLVEEGKDVPWFIRKLDETLTRLHSSKELLLPNLQRESKTLLVLSDYGGEHEEAKYYSYSFLFTNAQALGPFLKHIHAVRNEAGMNSPYREMGYKKIQPGPILRALDGGWIHSFEQVPGLLFTLLVDKKIHSLFGPNSPNTLLEITQKLEKQGCSYWKPEIAEKLFRVLHVVGYFVGLLSKENHMVFWMSDKDAIIANDKQLGGAGNVLGALVKTYTPHKIGRIGFGPEFSKADRSANASKDICELLAITDLVAGAVEDLYSKSKTQNEPLVKRGAEIVDQWLCHQGILCKKLIIAFNAVGSENVITSVLSFKHKEIPDNVTLVPVDIE